MSEQQIEVKTITEQPEWVLNYCLLKLVTVDDVAERATLVRMASDAFEEYKLQNNSTIL